jgi:hypothetical protein
MVSRVNPLGRFATTKLAGALHPYVSYRLRFVASRDEIGCRGVEPPLASGRRGP